MVRARPVFLLVWRELNRKASRLLVSVAAQLAAVSRRLMCMGIVFRAAIRLVKAKLSVRCAVVMNVLATTQRAWCMGVVDVMEMVLVAKDWLLDLLTFGWWSEWQGSYRIFIYRKDESDGKDN